jgi:uncharacterized protein
MSAGPVMPVARRLLKLQPITDGTVEIDGGFWGARRVRNREVTIPYGIRMLEESGTLENFRIAAGTSKGDYELPLFRDSDLYKVLEAIAWERAHGVVPEQDAFLRTGAELIEAAQENDGYINTYVQVVNPGGRFADPAMGHELYCAGHLTQAAVADIRTGGADSALVRVASRFASFLVDGLPATFVPGHPEIETALAELYRTTGDERFLALAGDLIGRRGHGSLHWHSFQPSYFQDDVPFEEATTIRGHAVRALYLLAGATDVYTETGREELLAPILAQWEDMVSGKTYLTGGIGSRHEGESFGDPFELPPDRAYCETCAAVASIMWNWRLLLLTGEARFADLLERTLYNGFLSGLGLDGTSFFYVNPLQSREPATRRAWYNCACCPPNIMRLLASLEHYTSTRSGDGVQVHQYMTGRISDGAFELEVETGYPYEGAVALRVTAAPGGARQVALRVPSWAAGASCTVNGRAAEAEPDGGYLGLERDWQVGDEIVLELPLRARVVDAAHEIDAVRGCVAFERGPLVYCVEGMDLPDGVHLDAVSVDAARAPAEQPGFDVSGHSVVALSLQATAEDVPPPAGWPYPERNGDGTSPSHALSLRATPYYAWGNRGATSMRVWVPRSAH